ncbi:MAG: redox-regulated ATPase YchF [bacterium]|nr:redox-regulated ATPase YchF [candidate division KSB1 bacterium]MDH7561219.1 redox-regulated ATPase YchF [bacterium]
MRIGIVGLPLSGKTTLFNALTRGHVKVDSFLGAKEEAHVGVVKVPDPRLDFLAQLFQPKKVTATTVEYVDVAGLEKGVSKKSGLGDQLLGRLRTVDALLVVLRLFADAQVLHPEGSIDARRDFSILHTEFVLSDLSIVEHRLEKLRKSVLKTHSLEEQQELQLMERCLEELENERPLRALILSHEEERLARPYQFLTLKPLLIVLNLGEEQIPDAQAIVASHADMAGGPWCAMDAVSAKLEMEIAQLAPEDAQVFSEEMGLKEPAMFRLVRTSYELLRLVTFFTYVSEEVRAWTIPRGTTAKLAAGAVHTDIERGFIRAEVVSYADLNAHGSLARCRELGLLRLEGKDYIVQDGDVITFRFHV